MILTTGKIVFVTDPDESDCYIENLRHCPKFCVNGNRIQL